MVQVFKSSLHLRKRVAQPPFFFGKITSLRLIRYYGSDMFLWSLSFFDNSAYDLGSGNLYKHDH
jgi:hypothetical protein